MKEHIKDISVGLGSMSIVGISLFVIVSYPEFAVLFTKTVGLVVVAIIVIIIAWLAGGTIRKWYLPPK